MKKWFGKFLAGILSLMCMRYTDVSGVVDIFEVWRNTSIEW